MVSMNADEREEQKKDFFKGLGSYSQWVLIILGGILGLTSLITITSTLLQYLSSTEVFSLYYSDILLAIFTFYYASWAFGLSRDLSAEESTLRSAPNKGKITKSGHLLIISLALIFGIVVIYKGNIQLVSSFLLLFLIANYIGWEYVKRFIKNSISEDLTYYQQKFEFIKYEKLKKIEEWLFGVWVTHRFVYAFAFIAIINFFVYTSLNSAITVMCNIHCVNFIPITLIGAYTVTIEAIIWYYRLKRDYSLKILSDLERK